MKVPKKKWVQQVLYLNNVIIQEMTATYTSINQCKEVKIVVHLNFSILVKNSDKLSNNLLKYTIWKQWRHWSDAAFHCIWSGSAMFANYPIRVLQTTIG